MNIVFQFMYDNYLTIVILIVFTFLFLIISQSKWNFNPDIPPPKLIKEVTIETMSNIDTMTNIDTMENQTYDNTNDYLKINPADSFCESFLEDASNLELSCNRLTKDTCMKTSCCVYTNNDTCVAGSKHGPTFKTDKQGTQIPYDYYYHKGIRY